MMKFYIKSPKGPLDRFSNWCIASFGCYEETHQGILLLIMNWVMRAALAGIVVFSPCLRDGKQSAFRSVAVSRQISGES